MLILCSMWQQNEIFLIGYRASGQLKTNLIEKPI